MPERRYLPFKQDFYAGLRDGVKTMTCRTSRYGNEGDVVDSPIGPLQLVSVEKVCLGVVAEEHWAAEGCESPEHFQAVWAGLHPGTGWDPERWVWLHEFRRVES